MLLGKLKKRKTHASDRRKANKEIATCLEMQNDQPLNAKNAKKKSKLRTAKKARMNCKKLINAKTLKLQKPRNARSLKLQKPRNAKKPKIAKNLQMQKPITDRNLKLEKPRN